MKFGQGNWKTILFIFLHIKSFFLDSITAQKCALAYCERRCFSSSFMSPKYTQKEKGHVTLFKEYTLFNSFD